MRPVGFSAPPSAASTGQCCSPAGSRTPSFRNLTRLATVVMQRQTAALCESSSFAPYLNVVWNLPVSTESGGELEGLDAGPFRPSQRRSIVGSMDGALTAMESTAFRDHR